MSGRSRPKVALGRTRLPLVAICALFGMLPDIDFLLGGHQGVTHTAGAALAVGLAVAALDRRPVVWIAASTAYGTHVLLDWLGTDTVAPIGVRALWPFDQAFYLSPYHWFDPVCRQYWLAECWSGLARAVWWELVLLGPLTALGLLLARRLRATATAH